MHHWQQRVKKRIQAQVYHCTTSSTAVCTAILTCEQLQSQQHSSFRSQEGIKMLPSPCKSDGISLWCEQETCFQLSIVVIFYTLDLCCVCAWAKLTYACAIALTSFSFSPLLPAVPCIPSKSATHPRSFEETQKVCKEESSKVKLVHPLVITSNTHFARTGLHIIWWYRSLCLHFHL